MENNTGSSFMAKKRQTGATQYGRSMIEMMGVLVIIGALSVGGMAGYTKALHQNKVNKTIEQISVISSHLSTIGANGGNYEGMSNKSAIRLKAVLPEMDPSCNTSKCTLKNPFGGSVDIKASSLLQNTNNNNADNQAYIIKYSGLDRKACLAIATHNWKSAKNSSFIGMTVGLDNNNGSAVDGSANSNLYLKCSGTGYNNATVTACNNGSVVGIPLTVAKTLSACSECDTQNCAIIFKYY